MALGRHWEETSMLGEPSHLIGRLMAVLKLVRPMFGRDCTMTLLLASQVIWGRSSKAHGRSSLPLFLEAACLVMFQPVHMGTSMTGVFVMLCSFALLRPSEPSRISGKQIGGPAPGTCHEHWSVVLHPLGDGCLSRTLWVDKTGLINLGQYHFASLMLQLLRSVATYAEFAFPSSTGQALLRLQLAGPAAGLDVLMPELHHPLRIGPCHGPAAFLRGFVEVHCRNRCGSDNMDRRGKRGARVVRRSHKLSLPARTAAVMGLARLVEAFKPPSIVPLAAGVRVGFDRRRSWYWLALLRYLRNLTLDSGNMRLRDCASSGSPTAVGTWLKHMSKKL